MGRLKEAKYYSLSSENLSLDNDEAIDFITTKDPRLNKDNVILYNGDAVYGGIFQEINDTADRLNLFAVEYFTFQVYDIDTNKDISYIAVIATRIDYKDENGKLITPKLNKSFKYADVYNKLGENEFADIFSDINTTVSISTLTLEYIAPTFEETSNILQLSA